MPPSFVGMVKKAIFPVRLSSECNTPERVFLCPDKPRNLPYNAPRKPHNAFFCKNNDIIPPSLFSVRYSEDFGKSAENKGKFPLNKKPPYVNNARRFNSGFAPLPKI